MPNGWGYCVFAEVVEGMDVNRTKSKPFCLVAVVSAKMFLLEDIIINSVTVSE